MLQGLAEISVRRRGGNIFFGNLIVIHRLFWISISFNVWIPERATPPQHAPVMFRKTLFDFHWSFSKSLLCSVNLYKCGHHVVGGRFSRCVHYFRWGTNEAPFLQHVVEFWLIQITNKAFQLPAQIRGKSMSKRQSIVLQAKIWTVPGYPHSQSIN